MGKSILVVYPVYQNTDLTEHRMIGQGVAFTDSHKGMEFQNYMNNHEYRSKEGDFYWTNHYVGLDVPEEKWNEYVERWNK